MNIVKVCTLVLSATAFLAGCSSTPAPVTAPEPVAAPVVAQAPAQAPAPAPAQNTAVDTRGMNAQAAATPTITLPAYLDPKSAISTARSVYFDFDDYTIKGDYTSLVEAHGKFLAGNGGVAVKIEGNADERGSKEYNLALGQKRAEAVVRALKTFGAQDRQMEATSNGEEKPVALGHDDAAWSKNRRADVIYPTK